MKSIIKSISNISKETQTALNAKGRGLEKKKNSRFAKFEIQKETTLKVKGGIIGSDLQGL